MLTIGVAKRDDVRRRLASAFKGKVQGSRFSFSTAQLLLHVLTEHRLDVLQTMCGAGPMSLRELSRRLDRDVKRVHGDAHALLEAGLLRKTDGGQIEFPFEALRVEFELKAKAA